MRNQITSVAAAILLLNEPSLTEARKQLVDANEGRLKSRGSPVVGSDTCEDYCIFGRSNEEKTYWCIAFTEPVLRTGWEYNQDANTDASATPLKYLRFDLVFYLSVHLQITSTMDIYRLYFGEHMFEVPQIDFKFDIGSIWNQKAQYCPHLVWDSTAIGVNSTYRQEFMNCSKTLVKNPWSIDGVYKGRYAKYFEECHRSQAGSASSDDPQVTATFWEKDFIEAKEDKVLVGTVDPTSDHYCENIPGFQWLVPEELLDAAGSPGSADQVKQKQNGLARQIHDNFFNYVFDMTSGAKRLSGHYDLI